MCPVANFHLSNGAEMYRLNCMGDPSSNGIKRSFGAMVNYLYKLDMLEENSRMYRERVSSSLIFPGAFRITTI